MRKLYQTSLVLLACLISIIIQAKEVKRETAENVAKIFLKSFDKKILLQIKEVLTVKSDEKNCFYVVNFQPSGFVIVSGSDIAVPVLGSSTESNLSLDNLPPQLKYLFDNYKKQILEIEKKDLNSTEETKQKWKEYSGEVITTTSGFLKSISTLPTQVPHLLQTTWGQGVGYNRFCPVDNSGPGGHVYAGCVATAMAQIVKYWGCKTNESGAHTDVYTNYGTLTVDLTQADYQWSLMGNTTSDDYNAKLIRDCGVAVDMEYSPTGSGAYIGDAQAALNSNFGFKNTSSYVYYSDDNQWKNILKQELSMGRPVLYGGRTNSDPQYSHSWVIEGYDSTDKFYCNWGYGGIGNAFYFLTNLTPDNGGHVYTSDNQAVIGIEPVMSTCDEINGGNVICSSGSSFNVPGVPSNSVTWNKSSNITFDNQPGNPKTFTANGSGSGWIEATVNINGSATLDRKVVWLGKVEENKIVSSRYGQADGAWAQYRILCNSGYTTAVAGYDSNGDQEPMGDTGDPSSQSITAYEWSFPSGWSYSSTGSGIPNERIQVSPLYYPSIGQMVQVGVRAQNGCGWTNWKYDYWQVVACGSYRMSISPNPATSEATISLLSENKEAAQLTTEWDLDVYDSFQGLKEKKTKLKTAETKINITGWKDGVYIVRAIIGDKVLTEKMIVKH